MLETQKYHYIDALRGVAILLVVLFHTSVNDPNLGPKATYFTAYGQMGVQLFYVLSAVTLCLSFEARQHEPKPIQSFYIRRFFRIAPLYYFALLLYMLLSAVNVYQHTGIFTPEDRYSTQNIFVTALFIQDVFPAAQNSVVLGGWSISVEMLFYALFPVLFLGIKSFSSQTPISASMVAFFFGIGFLVSYILAHRYGFPLANNDFIYLLIANQMPVFAIGISTYFTMAALRESLNGYLIFIFSSFIFIVFTFLSLMVWHSGATFAFIFVPLLSGISFAGLILFTAKFERTPRWLRRIGELSYAIYIMHFICTRYLEPEILRWMDKHLTANILLQFSLIFVLNMCLAYLMAALANRLIEAPGIAWGRRIIAGFDIKKLRQLNEQSRV
jgi:peptidoglycan/LPS O-acetylase OafA/YrhL